MQSFVGLVDVVCWLRGRVARVDCGGAAGAARGAEAVYSTFLFKRTRTMKFPKWRPGGARAPALHVWRGGRGRWLGGGRSPWRHPSAHMATGGVWNLLQVLFALFAHGHRRRKPSAPGAFWTVLLMEQVAKATCILCKKLQRTRGGTWRFPRVSRAKSGILWLSGGTTRFRWRGASYLGPSMISRSRLVVLE